MGEPLKIAVPKTSRRIRIGTMTIGGGEPIALQSMCATRTQDIEATVQQIRLLQSAGADLIRIAIDSKADVQALAAIRSETDANLVIDLQESYRLAKDVAPYVQKFRYNPGHLHHHQKNIPVADKVQFLIDTAGEHDVAIRIGVNFGSLEVSAKDQAESSAEAAVSSALKHCELMDKAGFERFVVSLKSSDPNAVIAINKRFASLRPEVPLHLGVTEAGLPPEGIIKTRVAFEQLLSAGIGDTVRVSLTVPDAEKDMEIKCAREIVQDISNGRFRSVPQYVAPGLNVISCPSCSRVENSAFVELARTVKEVSEYAKDYNVTIAVMGCRVNGPGETDDADIGLWCGPKVVNLKRGTEVIGAFPYAEVVARFRAELDDVIAQRQRLRAQS